ncbi:MAG: PD-(D/E)XK nuclease family protein [Bacteroidetes bacterium]|nr:PD-(D/E)XK nuclease family protein [Bacteroidota bacterium]
MKKYLLTGPFSLKKQRLAFDLAGLGGLTAFNPDRFLIILPNRRMITLMERALLGFTGKKALIHPRLMTIDEMWLSILRENHPDLRYETRWQRLLIFRKLLTGPFSDLIRNENPDPWLSYFDHSVRAFESVTGSVSDFPDLLLENWEGNREQASGFFKFYSAYLAQAEANSSVSRERIRFWFPDSTDFFRSVDSVLFLSPDEWIEDHWAYLVKNCLPSVAAVFSLDTGPENEPDSPVNGIVDQCFSSEWEKIRVAGPPEPRHRQVSGFSSIREEVEFIASGIRKQPHPLHELCVVVRDREKYLPWIRLIFSEAGIPYNVSSGFPSGHTSLFRLLNTILELSSGRADFRNLRQFLLHPLVKDNLTFRHVEMVFAQTGDHQSLNDWIVISEAESFGDAGLLNHAAIQTLTSLNRQILSWNSSPDFKSWLDFAESWIKSLLTADSVIDRLKVDFASWTVWQKLVTAFHDLARTPMPELSLSPADFRFILNHLMDHLTWNEPVRNGVQVLGPLEVKGTEFKSLFFCGLHSRVYPSPPKEGMLFSSRMMRNLDLFFFRMVQNREYAEFETIFSNPADSIFLTWTFEPGADSPEPSPFVLSRGLFPVQTLSGIPETSLRFKLLSQGADSFLPQFLAEKVRYSRHADQLNGPTRFDGLITSARAKQDYLAFLDSHFHELSATSLDSFAHCGQKFFYERFLHLAEEEEFQEETDARDRGNLLHAVLQHWANEKLNGNRANDWDLLCQAAENYAVDHLKTDKFLHRSYLRKLLNRKVSPLAGFLETQENLNQIQSPFAAEWTFGSGNSETPEFRVKTDTGREFLFKGKIDRIDKLRDGTVAVIDYKLSQQSNQIEKARSGISFQMLIYKEIAERLFPGPGSLAYLTYFTLAGPGGQPHERLKPFLGTRDVLQQLFPKNRRQKDLFKSDLERDDFFAEVSSEMKKKIKSLENGELFHNLTDWMPERSGFECPAYCAFSSICRKDESRLKGWSGKQEILIED